MGDAGRLTAEELYAIKRWQASLSILGKRENLDAVRQWLLQAGYVDAE